MSKVNNPVSAEVQASLARARDAQEPRTGGAAVSAVVAAETLYLTHANTVVRDGHPDAAFLLVRHGSTIPKDLADDLKLTTGTVKVETIVVPDMALPAVPTETQTRPSVSAPADTEKSAGDKPDTKAESDKSK